MAPQKEDPVLERDDDALGEVSIARGFEEYRTHVGPANRYDIFSAV